MATINKGILGGFSGKVGTIVGANFRGKDIIRSVPKPSGKLPTDKQLLQQAKFKLVISFLQPLKSIQNLYFGSPSKAKSKVNLAASYTLNNAIDVVAEVPQLVFNKILITKGELAAFQNLAGAPAANQKLNLTWDDNSMQGNAGATDAVNAVCYCEALGNFAIYQSFATRADLTGEISLPAYYAAQEVHVWLYMNNATQNLGCNSNYLGLLNIP